MIRIGPQTGGGGLGGVGGRLGGGGGGGGGSGASYVAPRAIGKPFVGTSADSGDGEVVIAWGAPLPTTTLSVAANPTRSGHFQLTAHVVPPAGVVTPAPTGNVSFYVDGTFTPLATVGVDGSGLAQATVGPFGAGTVKLDAVYNGDAVYSAAGSTVLSVVVVSPVVLTGAASSVSLRSAALTGTVNAEGVSVPAEFVWGTTTAYGQTTAPTSVSGTSPVTVRAALSGLALGTTYHYRLIVPATATAVAEEGPDEQFTTSSTAQVSITTTSLPNPVVGAAYAARVAAVNGTSPYTFSVLTGKLPAGLALNASTGAITGTPTTLGTSPVAIGVHDAASPASTATRALPLTVVRPAVTVTTTTLPLGTVGLAYHAIASATGGLAPYLWSIASGALPAGLGLNGATGVISGTPNTAGTTGFTMMATDSASPAVTATRAFAVTVRPAVQPAVYVVNGGSDTVESFSLTATINSRPLTSLTGPVTALEGVSAVAIDPAGDIFVGSSLSDAVEEFGPGATGNAAPTAQITGAHTGLVTPNALALDASGRLYVANQAAQTITEYAPGAQGDAKPVATIAGSSTGLSSPDGVTVDPSGDLWVSDDGDNSLTEYAPGANGNVAPLRTITGDATGLSSPDGLTIDAAGNVLVANPAGQDLTEYAPTASGPAMPLRTITGPGLIYPTGVDVDTHGTIYVADEFADTIFTFAAADSGPSVPLATITGPPTGLNGPTLLAVTPPLSVLTTALPDGRMNHRYHFVLRAGLGTTPYRWALAAGRLPRGLKLKSAGRIEGKPRHRGHYSLTVTVTDNSSPRATATQDLTVIIRGDRRQRRR